MPYKGVILGINDNYLEKYNFEWKPFGFLVKKFKYNFDIMSNTQINISCKKICILIEHEEVDIKRFTFPVTKEEILQELIKNELSYYYKKIDDIVFKFMINRRIQDNLEIIVFCLNTCKIRLAEKFINNTLINRVCLIQFALLKYYKKKLKSENYIFMFQYNDCIYFLCCVKNILIYNSLIKINESMEELNNALYNFIEKSRIYTDASISKIYCGNLNTSDFSPEFKKEFSLEDLGPVNEKKFLINMKKGR